MPTVLSPGPAPCSAPLTAPATLVYGVPAPERRRAVVAVFGGSPVVRWAMADRDGRPVDLSACVGPADGSLASLAGDAASLAGDESRVTLRLREMVGPCGTTAEFAGFVVDPAAGVVEVPLGALDGVPAPGVYVAELRLFGRLGAPGLSNTFFLYLEPGLFRTSPGRAGPPRVAEIRLALRDSSPAEARLLDTVTFDDAEVALAVAMPVEYYNEVSPPLEVCFDTTNFPSRHHWRQGAAAQLFFMVAEYYRKNQLQYQAGGIAVDDFNKAPLYEQAGAARWQEYKDWVRQSKVALNLAAGWGAGPSPYAATGWGEDFYAGGVPWH